MWTHTNCLQIFCSTTPPPPPPPTPVASRPFCLSTPLSLPPVSTSFPVPSRHALPGWLNRPMRGLDLAPMQWYEAWFDSGLSLVGWDGLIYDTYLPSIPSPPNHRWFYCPPEKKKRIDNWPEQHSEFWVALAFKGIYIYTINVYDWNHTQLSRVWPLTAGYWSTSQVEGITCTYTSPTRKTGFYVSNKAEMVGLLISL